MFLEHFPVNSKADKTLILQGLSAFCMEWGNGKMFFDSFFDSLTRF